MLTRFDIVVSTELRRADGSLFAYLGQFVWPGVNDDMRSWLSGSCHRAGMWLATRPEYPGGYSVVYRTRVWPSGSVDPITGAVPAEPPVSDTSEVVTEGLGYLDMVAFERFALAELNEMLELFTAAHTGVDPPGRRRGILRQYVAWAWGMIRSKAQ